MRKDPTEFRKRFAAWKNGKLPYENGLPKYLDGKDLQWDTFNYKIPYIPEKSIKLTNAGLATGARISTNMLDSLANTAEEIGLPIQTAIGLATKESTLGNPTDDRSMRTLLSAKRREDLEHELWKLGIRGNDQYGQHLVPDDAKPFYWDQLSLINYYNGEHHLPDSYARKENVNNLPSTLKKGLLFYKDHPDRYNPGQKNYQRLVDKRGAEVMLSPEVLKWLKERNIKKATGRFNRLNPLLNESKLNPTKYKDGKLPGYKDGDKPITVGLYNVYPSAVGASELSVTTPEVVVTGKDRRPLYQRYDAQNSIYDKTMGLRDAVHNISAKSGGDAGPIGVALGVIGALRGMNKPWIGDYNGLTSLDGAINDSVLYNPENKNLLKLSFYGDERGFKKYTGDPIIVNGNIFENPNRYYNHKIIPVDTLYFPSYAKHTIDSIANLLNIYGFNIKNITSGFTPNDFSENEKRVLLEDAKNGNMSIKKDHIRFFDKFDNGFIYNMFPKQLPVFIHDVPFKFGKYSDRDLKILRNVINTDYDSSHDDAREIKLLNTINDLLYAE